MTPAHECLYDVSWQKLRLSVFGKWATEEETRDSISRLLAYIGRAENRYWKFVRVWRCVNIVAHAELTAEKHENTKGLRLIKVFKRGLEIEYNRYKHASPTGAPFRQWNWKKVGDDLQKLHNENYELFKRMRMYSEGRLYGRGKGDPTSKEATPELARFVRMMRDTVFDAG